MPVLESAELAVTTFVASSYATEACGSNGLPLTPNSVCILGKFQMLKSVSFDGICQYVDIVRGKHERLYVVSEYYQKNLQDEIKVGSQFSHKEIVQIAFEVLQSLTYLNNSGIVHRCLSPGVIQLTHQNRVKLSNYGLYHISDYGQCVSFPIGEPKYMCPEVLCSSPKPHSYHAEPFNSDIGGFFPSGPKVDVWSLGIIIIELYLGKIICRGWSLEHIIRRIISFASEEHQDSVLDRIFDDENALDKLQSMPSDIRSLLEICLSVDVQKRQAPVDFLEHTAFKSANLVAEKSLYPEKSSFPSVKLRCRDLTVPAPVLHDVRKVDHLRERSIFEIYYLWLLVGGDIDGEYRRHGFIKSRPPISSLPSVVIEECQNFGEKRDRSFLLDHKSVILSLEQLKERLSAIDHKDYYPLIENAMNSLPKTQSSNELASVSKLPLVIREKDVEYQLHRLLLYSRLLDGYPYKKLQICKEARIDIPPLYRNHVWAVLLDVDGDGQAVYDSIDKETPTTTDRQIEVDIPRCHQYDELLSSPTGHAKFKRLLKAWVVSHPQYVYWQGLDSLCAPFLYLNFSDEALAYACLSAFISKYLHNFFLKDNSAVIQEYLAVFAHLIAFHDPELATHLESIGFIPELYAIPWFLTMYTHVFPLSKIFYLWDTLLLGNTSFPLCVGVAILAQLRANLLSFGFNECILLFSDMPEIDIEKCVSDSIKLFCSMPKSVAYRQHERKALNKTSNKGVPSLSSQQATDDAKIEGLQLDLGMDPLPLEVLKSEVSPRISAEDLLDLLGLTPGHITRQPKIRILVIDVRGPDDYNRGAIPGSINIPFQTAFTSDGGLLSCPEVNSLYAHKGKLIVVVGNRGTNAKNFSAKLARLGFSKSCILHKGIDVLRPVGVLVVPSV